MLLHKNYECDRAICLWLPKVCQQLVCIFQISFYQSLRCELLFIELDDIASPLVRDFISSIGYTRLIDIAVQTLRPGTYIDIHRDDHYKRAAYPYIKGCKKLYWACKAHEGVYFKQGRGGILPLDRPLLLNTIEHPHAVWSLDSIRLFHV